MKNHQIEATWNYHNSTKHSPESLRNNSHSLDWENQPLPFKIYSDVEPLALSKSLSSSVLPALSAIASTTAESDPGVHLSRQILAEILFLSAGVTKRRHYPGGEMLFRAAACTGALYHIDLYVACGGLTDLDAGVYQFSPHDFSLRRLRAGDYRSCLAQASGQEAAIVDASCILVGASTYWRNAWKYQARAYRHCYWDNGTLLANLLAAATARKIPVKVVLGFVDAAVSELLGLDPQREAAISLVGLGDASPRSPALFPPMKPVAFETLPLSKSEVDYPAMRAMHGASSLESESEVVAWRLRAEKWQDTARKSETRGSRLFPLQRLPIEDLPRDTLDEVVMRRGSTREFSRDSIELRQLSTLIDRATRGINADFLIPVAPSLIELYLIIHAVEGLPSGAYCYRRTEHALELLKLGDFRREARYLGLGQEIPADCSVNIYCLANLTSILDRFGNRGYRAAQLEAAVMGGKFYLAAYAQRLGASGLTFFDDDVIRFFAPHADGMDVMFLIALGKSLKRKG